MNIKELGAEVVKACREFVEQKFGVISKQVDELKMRVDALPVPKDGRDGKDADPAQIKALVDAAVAQIPVPKDGASVTVDDVAPLIEARVKAAVAEIPVPENGKDADPEVVAELVRAEVAKLPTPADGKSVTLDEVTPVIAAEVEKAVAAIPAPKDGRDGKDAEPLDQAAIVREVVAQIPQPKDGTSVTVEDVAPLIEEQVKAAVEAIPKPLDGKDAEPLDQEAIAAAVLQRVRVPEDGKSVTVADVQPLVADLVEKAVAALPKAKDGESVPVEQVQRMIDEAVAKAVAAVPVPKDGEHGRDALDIEILPAINETRRYARGTYASHNGGLWRAMRSTEGMDGWECVVRGIESMQLVQGENAKAFMLQVEMSDGSQVGKSFFLPAMIYRGVFREGEDYTPGDTVTWGGSLWHCNEQTKDKPTDGSKAWQLAAKRGRDGKDGRDGIDKTAPVKL
jgi:hypothetical protein